MDLLPNRTSRELWEGSRRVPDLRLSTHDARIVQWLGIRRRQVERETSLQYLEAPSKLLNKVLTLF